jgi:hypothetical protein
MKFTIITPTLLRHTLERTCRSIEGCSHKDWQHIVVIDKKGRELPGELRHPNRVVITCAEDHHGWWGAPCRRAAYPLITGDYVLYLDDDDYYVNDCLGVLAGLIKDEDWGVFRCKLQGDILLWEDPGLCNTASMQFYHRPVINGYEMKWPMWGHPETGMDGRLVNILKNVSDNWKVHYTAVLAEAPMQGGQRG